MEQPNYYAVIPANVRYDKNLKPMAKLLYGEISALAQKDGKCWATNSYFAELYDLSKETISRLISDLVSAGYIESELIYKEGTKEIANRYLKICGEAIDEKVKSPIDEKVKENNTSTEQYKSNIRNTKESELSLQIHEIISHLNLRLGCSYQENTKDTRNKIKARLKEGFSVEDFKKVIDSKAEDWENDQKMKEYLRPITLFGTKFESYLQQAIQKENTPSNEFLGFKIE